jgi:hypothetical protein
VQQQQQQQQQQQVAEPPLPQVHSNDPHEEANVIRKALRIKVRRGVASSSRLLRCKSSSYVDRLFRLPRATSTAAGSRLCMLSLLAIATLHCLGHAGYALELLAVAFAAAAAAAAGEGA